MFGNQRLKKSALYFLITLSTVNGSTGWSSTIADHPERPFLTSVPALFMSANQFKPEAVEITLTPDRSLPARYNKSNHLVYAYALQSRNNAPVLFVIPGLGGTAESGGTMFLAQLAFAQGYSVVTLPSSTHWSFALAASKTGRPGYLPNDAKDHYALMTKIKNHLQKKHGLRPSQWGLMGYSYGGLDSAFVMAEDLNQKEFNFNFMVLISPPMNRATAIAKIDHYYDQGKQWPESTRQKLATFGMGRVVEIMQGKVKIDSYEDLQKAFPLKENSLAWLLANEFRRALQNSAFVGDLIEKRNTSSTTETIPTSISDYIAKDVFAQIAKRDPSLGSTEILAKQSELLYSLNKGSLLREKKVVIFHSSNDYTSFPEGEQTLKALPIESHLYHFGGHLGFLSDKTVLEDLKTTLKGLK